MKNVISIKVLQGKRVVTQDFFSMDCPKVLKKYTWEKICNQLKSRFPQILKFRDYDYKERRIVMVIKVLRSR